MKWPMLKILRDHIMNHHMVAAAEGGRHHVVRGGRRPPLIMWSPFVFWALASASFIGIGLPYFIGFGHFLFFWLWPPIILILIKLIHPYMFQSAVFAKTGSRKRSRSIKTAKIQEISLRVFLDRLEIKKIKGQK